MCNRLNLRFDYFVSLCWYGASFLSLNYFYYWTPSCFPDLSTCSSWYSKSSVLHNVCPIGVVLGRNILSGTSFVTWSVRVCIFGCLLKLFFLYWNVWQARAVSTDGLRPSFYIINSVMYAIQVILLWKLVELMIFVFCYRNWRWAIFDVKDRWESSIFYVLWAL